ncbi:cell envelope integrity protein TolA, partial [Rickettsia endosymbiont of Culicoides newsteadi]
MTYIVKKEIETAIQINKNFPAEAKKEALAKQIAEQARQKEAERLAKEANIREQEEAEAAKEAARLKAIEEARQQEAERLEQEAKLKEQEEVKAAKEAARLKAIEEAKIKEYIPNIPAVKLFEVEGEDNQFDNDNQATIKEVSKLIRDGNDRLQEHGKKGILLLGNTGAGKSTLTHLFSSRRYWTEKSRQKNNNFVSHFCIFQAA